MTAVILGLVAVVLLVLVVVALGMRSMNRRESALSSERIKAMAEGKGPKSRRPAEETFFESFPEGFDAFEEPAKRAAVKQNGAPPRPAQRPGGRQAARPAQRGGKPAGKPGGKPATAATAPRGKRGVDEWGADDDYDDDYWSRVRADDGAFGGTIKQRMAAPRPVEAEAGVSAGADPNAATVQAPLPQRPVGAPGIAAAVPGQSPGLADLVEPLRATPASAIAEEKTMTFSAPTPDPMSTYTGTPTGPLAMPEPSRSTGPFSSTGPFEPTPSTGPFLSGPSTGSFEASRVSAYEPPRTSGSFDAVPPVTGSFPATGAFEVPRGAFEAPRAPSGSFPTVEPPYQEPAYQEPSGWSQPAYPPTPPAPAAQPPTGWTGVRDVLDDPEPPRRDDSWSTSGNYQLPSATYDTGYGSYQQPEPPATSYSSYEVSAGWATIDDSDSVSYDTPSGQDRRYDYETGGYPQQGANPAAGSWPSYDELYGGTESTTQSGSRRGNHRNPETDYPDYYR
ncbi:hypothetical protein Aph01nite_50770 [Acrocarpospora phusangensis]|uniref:Uncharacterized protein n=1 Tax=Acrocarpospora phusangensis TaxID=1070424 RepID=A0A919QD61_9ACTN|nr:hypothetical protein [Acrocarpospora phusangensis]GIH26767.1 hypothetical protein Aph01nite_50770 [Acrocarpospora phusangensis]